MAPNYLTYYEQGKRGLDITIQGDNYSEHNSLQKRTDNGPREPMEKTCCIQDYNCSANVSPQLTNLIFKIVKHCNYTPF